MEPKAEIESATSSLQVMCSAIWATSAFEMGGLLILLPLSNITVWAIRTDSQIRKNVRLYRIGRVTSDWIQRAPDAQIGGRTTELNRFRLVTYRPRSASKSDSFDLQ